MVTVYDHVVGAAGITVKWEMGSREEESVYFLKE